MPSDQFYEKGMYVSLHGTEGGWGVAECFLLVCVYVWGRGGGYLVLELSLLFKL